MPMEKKTLFVSIMIFLRNINAEHFEVWTQTRSEAGPLFGKLEFPGGKIDFLPDQNRLETPREAIVREVHEEVGIDLSTALNIHFFKMHSYETDTKIINLMIHTLHQKSLKILETLPESGWLKIDYVNLSRPYQGIIPEANHGFLDELAIYLSENYQFETCLFL